MYDNKERSWDVSRMLDSERRGDVVYISSQESRRSSSKGLQKLHLPVALFA
jgi:hypothetical protein